MTGALGTSEKTYQEKGVVAGHPPILLRETLAIDATARTKGTVLGKVTGGDYAPYVNTNNDGTETARVILMEDVDAHATTVEALVLVHGDVVEDDLTGIDDAGKADLFSVGIFVK